ncbi:glycosyltransferase family 4 protein [Roseospira marina]|uniref:Glycosyltransferase family 4 protein n=1 Tax=Roseospira marina TaxID=140057 RepID=A0A5M6IFG4_9PROT|nr:glycosyltransferase family 4 protein [Roseospira marina]KAA5607034.1 glycosyltransferase family 4 protein [Roseospira marina]MBB4312779.1 glycosyltransferase involved in cell wall biosynthesis [Roseospira marina]MBB5086448.1 glycosyltransferase involved in cell wall biosynthesis [Roseospira marina]
MTDSSPPTARVCLVTTEILGPTRTGGIATVLSALADGLVAQGHTVTVLCLNGTRSMDGPFDRWVAHYRRRGITLVPLPDPTDDATMPAMGGLWAERSLARRWQVLAWLEAQAFDLVHFNDWGGEAALAGRARAQGIALRQTRLVLGLHGASDWAMTGNDTPLEDLPRLIQIELERIAPRLMDAVWSPSGFMPAWLEARGAPAPDVRLMPQPLPDPGPPRPPATETAPITHLVLFGRLEDRKGVAVLLDALDRLAEATRTDPTAAAPTAVIFLGRAATVQGEPAARVIGRRAASWPWPATVCDSLDRDAALALLRAPGRLALILAPAENSPMTLHECLALRIPVLASATGGIPELIATEDHARVLVPYDADALAERLGTVLGQPFAPARPAHDARDTARIWAAWHADLLATPGDRTPPTTPQPNPITPLIAPADTPGPTWKAALVARHAANDPTPVCLLTDADQIAPGALSLLDAVLVRTGAALLAPAWRDARDGRVFPCLDSVPASAQATPLVAGPGLVLTRAAIECAARDWDPLSGLWGLVAVCRAAGLTHEAVPRVLVSRRRPWTEPPTALARAPRLWAAVTPPVLAPLTAALLAGLSAARLPPGSSAARPLSTDARERTARRDRRRALALWRSWPWRVTRPLRNRTRRRAGLPPEPVEPPPLTAPGAASDVLFGMLVSRSWPLGVLVATPIARIRAQIRAGIWGVFRRRKTSLRG